jgi:hypothetical protein
VQVPHPPTVQHPANHEAHFNHNANSSHHQTGVVQPGGHPTGANYNRGQMTVPQPAIQSAPPPQTKEQQQEVYAQSQGFRSAEQFHKWQQNGRVDAPPGIAGRGGPASQHGIMTPVSGVYPAPKIPATFTQRHYELPKTALPPNEKVAFHPGNHIPGCHDWRGPKYDVFRNYSSTWQDKHWWTTHHHRIVLVFGGWYYWNSGYWYPAWGYHPDAVYAYDGPIYAYHNEMPDQVVANVQAALQELGYYHGPINGVLGSETRDAIANYQRDHGLFETMTVDEVTLETLGMT